MYELAAYEATCLAQQPISNSGARPGSSTMGTEARAQVALQGQPSALPLTDAVLRYFNLQPFKKKKVLPFKLRHSNWQGTDFQSTPMQR